MSREQWLIGSATVQIAFVSVMSIGQPTLVQQASPAAAQDKKADELDGTWAQVGYENYGKLIEIAKAEQGTHTFDQGKLKIKVPVLKLDKAGTHGVDNAKNPKQLDLAYKIGDKVQTIQCIYEVNGDALRIAQPFDGPKGLRPTEMKSNTQAQVMIFKRQKD